MSVTAPPAGTIMATTMTMTMIMKMTIRSRTCTPTLMITATLIRTP